MLKTNSKKILFQSFYLSLITLSFHCVVFNPKVFIWQGQTAENVFCVLTSIILICLMIGVPNTKPFKWSKAEWMKQKRAYKRREYVFLFLIFYFLIEMVVAIIFKATIVNDFPKASFFSYITRLFLAALTEELQFKAFWYRGIATETKIPFLFNVLLVSLIFSILHTNYFSYWPTLIYTFAWHGFSMIFFNYCSSLWISTAFHFGSNMIIFIVKSFT